MKLVSLQPEMEAAYADFVQDFTAAGEKVMPGAAGSSEASFTDYLRHLERRQRWEGCPPGIVPSHLYFLEEGGRLLGAIDLRWELNERLLHYAGQIGYGVRPTARGRGLATRMLGMALEKVRTRGWERVLITCLEENRASARVIEKNGGRLEDCRSYDGHTYRRYWIALSPQGRVTDGSGSLQGEIQ